MNYQNNRIANCAAVSPAGALRVLLIAIALLLAGCSEDFLFIPGSEDSENEEQMNPSEGIVGLWDWVQSAQGMGTGFSDTTGVQTPTENDRRTLQFNSDGTYVWQQLNAQGEVLSTDAGTWKAENGQLTYNENSGFPVTYDYSITGNILRLSMISQDGEFAYWTSEIWQRE